MKQSRVFVLAAFIFVALGVILELVVPASARVIDIGAAVFAAATWIVPPLRLATYKSKKPGSSLAAVGMTIHIVVLAAVLRAAGTGPGGRFSRLLRSGWPVARRSPSADGLSPRRQINPRADFGGTAGAFVVSFAESGHAATGT
jgi:hypothetical protein